MADKGARGNFRAGIELIRRSNLDEYLELFFNKAVVHYAHGQFWATLRTLQKLHDYDPDYPEVESWIEDVKRIIHGGDDGPPGVAARLQPPPPPPLRAVAARRFIRS